MTSVSDHPINAPEHCPGTASEDAGKVSACAGCPNQQVCASGVPNGPDPAVQLVKDRLEQVRNKILILSGKGGVGKSTVTALLSRSLAAKDRERNQLMLVYKMAEKNCDLQTMDLISAKFIDEQNKSICEIARLLTRANKIAVNDDIGEFLFDKEILYKSFVNTDNNKYK